MKISYTIMSQQGARDENQDRTGALLGERSACFLVCDGVAGLPGGDLAAQLVRDRLLASLDGESALSPQQTHAAVAACQQSVLEAQRTHPDYPRMSTTLAALFIDREQQQAWWAHAGDSRVYHFRRGFVREVTRDHSLAQQLQDAGYENTGINSNLLYNALGADADREASYSEQVLLEDGDAFLVCTDGFWLNLTSAEMEQALRMVTACDQWLTLMQKAINRSSKSDNLSAVAVWIGSPQETTLLHSPTDSARFLPPRQ